MKGVTGIRWSRAIFTLGAGACMAAGAVLALAGPALGQAGGRGSATSTRGAAVDPSVAAYQQARALFEQEDYAGAAREADRALSLNPNLQDAKILRQVALTRAAAATRTGAATGPGGAPKLLTAEQVSALKLAELQGNETGLQGKIDRKTLDLFWNEVVKQQKGGDVSRAAYDAFMNPANFSGQVAAIRAANLQQYLSKVTLTSDPANMIAFKQQVHPFVLANCATANCHGGGNAGNLRLVRPAAAMNDRILYTNFYTLATYVTKDGERVINRDDPRKSLLLQYGLPKGVAAVPHPGNVRMPRTLGTEKSPEFVGMVEWVRSLTFPTPVYRLPGLPAAGTEPAPATTMGSHR
jgi:hypothetical protein